MNCPRSLTFSPEPPRLTWSVWLRAGHALAKAQLLDTLETLIRWQERARQRHCLQSLDDRLLKDIGLSRSDIQREIDKPFWRG